MSRINFEMSPMLLTRIDRILAKKRAQNPSTLSDEQFKEARRISKAKGLVAANEYIEQLKQETRHNIFSSRNALLRHIVESGIAAMEQAMGEESLDEAPAAKIPEKKKSTNKVKTVWDKNDE